MNGLSGKESVKRELRNAVAFMKKHGIYSEEHEDILVRTLHKKGKSECSCTTDATLHKSVQLADSLTKKCSICLSKSSIKRLNIKLCPTKFNFHIVSCSSCLNPHLFNVIGYLLDRNADISEYVLNKTFHCALLYQYSRCSIQLLFRSYGMKHLDRRQFDYLAKLYCDWADYETLGLLYMAGNSFPLHQSVCNLPVSAYGMRATERKSWNVLQSCIAHTTCLEEDMTTLSPIQCLTYAAKQPRTLLNCCVISIRKEISSNVVNMADHLPLPLKLKDEIRFTNFRSPCSSGCHGWRQKENNSQI